LAGRCDTIAILCGAGFVFVAERRMARKSFDGKLLMRKSHTETLAGTYIAAQHQKMGSFLPRVAFDAGLEFSGKFE
jgi:hypothetical protein